VLPSSARLDVSHGALQERTLSGLHGRNSLAEPIMSKCNHAISCKLPEKRSAFLSENSRGSRLGRSAKMFRSIGSPASKCFLVIKANLAPVEGIGGAIDKGGGEPHWFSSIGQPDDCDLVLGKIDLGRMPPTCPAQAWVGSAQRTASKRHRSCAALHQKRSNSAVI